MESEGGFSPTLTKTKENKTKQNNSSLYMKNSIIDAFETVSITKAGLLDTDPISVSGAEPAQSTEQGRSSSHIVS